MVPSHALRFQSMLRAMVEVVIPALPSDQRLALDQAQIIAGNLRILIDQAGRTSDYDRVDLAESAALGRKLADLLDVASAIDTATPDGERALADRVAATKQVTDALLRTALDHDDAAIRGAAGRLVLDQAEKQLIRERVWLRGAGFELDPEALPALDAVLTPID